MSIRIVDGGGLWQDSKDIRVVDGTTWKRVQKIMVVDDTGLWQTAFVFDNVGPSAVTSAKAEWSTVSGAPRCVVTWTNPNVSDFARTLVHRYSTSVTRTDAQLAALSEPSWLAVGTTGTPLTGGYTGINTAKSLTDDGATKSAFTTYGPDNLQSNIHYYRFTPYDTRGNPGTVDYVGSVGNGTSVVRGWWSSPFQIKSTSGGTYRDSSWRTDSIVQDGAGGFTRAVQQRFSTATGYNYGFYFYGTRPASGSINATATEILVKRNSDSGSSGNIPPVFRLSSHSSASGVPTGATFSFAVTGTGLGFNGVAWHDLSANWGEEILTQSPYRSINLYTETAGYYAVFLGFGDLYGTLPNGTLRLTHGG